MLYRTHVRLDFRLWIYIMFFLQLLVQTLQREGSELWILAIGELVLEGNNDSSETRGDAVHLC